MFAKEYAREGQVKRTSFLSERHIEDVMTLMQQVQAKL